jgi:hypothetical protein
LTKATEHEQTDKNVRVSMDNMNAHADCYMAMQHLVGNMAQQMQAFSRCALSEVYEPLSTFAKDGTIAHRRALPVKLHLCSNV